MIWTGIILAIVVVVTFVLTRRWVQRYDSPKLSSPQFVVQWSGPIITSRPLSFSSVLYKTTSEFLDQLSDSDVREAMTKVEQGLQPSWSGITNLSADPSRIFYLHISTENKVVRGGILEATAFGEQVQRTEEEHAFYERMVADLMHELKTPITLLSAPIAMLIKNLQGTPNEKLLRMMERNASELSDLVTYILDFSRLKHGSLPNQSEPFEVDPFLDELIARFEYKAQESNLSIQVQTDTVCTVTMDKKLVSMVINNLLMNCIKYAISPSHINIEWRVQNDNLLIIQVTNQCQPISINEQIKMFNKYTMLNDKMKGSGIGLALTKELIESIGGSIRAEAEGDLLKVKVSLPVHSTALFRAAPHKISTP